MTNKNNSGMTIVEVLVSVVIISLVMSLLFTLLIQVQKANTAVTEKSSLLISQAVVTKAIEADMIEIGVHSVSLCEPEDFNMGNSLIDKSAGYVCVKLEYNLSYDVSDLGYILVYKQNKEKYDNPSWVIKYERGYYEDCIANQAPSGGSAWKGTYSVVQKLDADISLSSSHKAILKYSAQYDPSSKYNAQRTNNASLRIPITDSNEYHYDIDLSFSFKLYYPDTEAARYQDRVDFFCDNTNKTSEGDAPLQLLCDCTGSNCNDTYASEHKAVNGLYNYICSETKTTTLDAAGLNKNFLQLDMVKSVGITASNIKTVKFQSELKNPYTNQGIDVSYSQNKTTMLFFNPNTEDPSKYDIVIGQSGAVTMYGNSMARMFAGYTALTSIDFNGFDSTGITNMASLFKGCTSLYSSGLKNFSTLNFESVQNMSAMFQSTKISSIPFNTDSGVVELPSLKNAMHMFRGTNVTQFIYGTDFYSPNLEAAQYMFAECGSLKTVKFEGNESADLVFNRLTDMSYMFYYTDRITTMIINHVSMPELLSMEDTFYRAAYYSYADKHLIDNFNTPKLNTISYLYYNSDYLNNHLTIGKWYTPSLTNAYYAFYNTNSTYDLDLSGMDFSNVTNCSNMFNDSNIKRLVIGTDWYNVKDMSYIFYNCPSLEKITLSDGSKVWNLPSVTNASYAFAYASNGVSNHSFDWFDEIHLPKCTNFKYMFYSTLYKYIKIDGIHSEVAAGTYIYVDSMFAAQESSSSYYKLRNISMKDANFKGTVSATFLFSKRPGLLFTEYDGEIDRAKYYNDEYELVSNPLRNFTVDTGYVYDMSFMFNRCVALKGLPDDFFSNFNTNATTKYTAMFYQFGYDNPGYHIGSKYGLVLPFSSTSPSSVEKMFSGVSSVPFIRFTGDFYLGTGTTNTGSLSYYNSGYEYYYGGFFSDLANNSDHMDKFELDINNLNQTNATYLKSAFDSITKDIQAPVVITLSSNSDLAKTQYCAIESSSLKTHAPKGITYVNQDSSWTC